MSFEILYHESVVSDDIPKLPKEWQGRIQKAIEGKLVTQPEVFGKPLSRSLKNYRKLRVGDYRVVFRVEKRIVKILTIKHRSIVYEKIIKRL